jgi:uncharacterized protein with NRDE domain
MCLLAVAFRTAPGLHLVLAGNRDEFHARAALPMDWWSTPRMLAGRDVVAGGTWLAAADDGRFGVVTNFRGGGAAPPGAPSRGDLLPAYFAGGAGPLDFLARLAAQEPRHAGFSLLLGDRHGLAYWSNRTGAAPRALAPGFYGLSNGALDAPWPKLTRTRARLAEMLAVGPPGTEALLELMADRTPAPDHDLPDTGIGLERERLLSAPFIVGEAYGTRCSTALVVAADGSLEAAERTWRPDGQPAFTRRFAARALAA